MDIKKYGAIDIGSNAMRLLLIMVIDDGVKQEFKKVSLVRLPVRLGSSAFSDHNISDETLERFLKGMEAYKLLMDVHGVEDHMAVATSAMRETSNGAEIVSKVKETTGIDIQIINGKREAEIIFKAHFKDSVFESGSYIYCDVGGGSTEVTILQRGHILASKSFKVGSIRMLKNLVTPQVWQDMKQWVKKQTAHLHHVEMIGSGGNINKAYKLLNKEYPTPMLYHELKILRKTIQKMSVEQRMINFKLNPDRADVIEGALDIYYHIMKWADSSILHVPKIGLGDGMVQLMHEKAQSKSQ
jgi:exopolyphosphatase/guanosine-5'-triphosphate,3'-diphosphate pyrophosphatase